MAVKSGEIPLTTHNLFITHLC